MSCNAHQSFSLSSIHSDTGRPVGEIWGDTLSDSNRRCRFALEDDRMIHLLSLWTICLGDSTTDETHIISAESIQTQKQPIVIASLHPSAKPMVNLCGLDLSPPVTFILTSGSGPVYISGQHVIVDDDLENLPPEEECLDKEMFKSRFLCGFKKL
ncbi:nucleoplasmin-like [Pyxicephalus adspersus]|uniref:nucleoplasmin-like n=1 Tax=Pyxicephalus adspersus TaxID=30357 RepID=UPI003B58F073